VGVLIGKEEKPEAQYFGTVYGQHRAWAEEEGVKDDGLDYWNSPPIFADTRMDVLKLLLHKADVGAYERLEALQKQRKQRADRDEKRKRTAVQEKESPDSSKKLRLALGGKDGRRDEPLELSSGSEQAEDETEADEEDGASDGEETEKDREKDDDFKEDSSDEDDTENEEPRRKYTPPSKERGMKAAPRIPRREITPKPKTIKQERLSTPPLRTPRLKTGSEMRRLRDRH
jgi:hypothetical protein